MLSVMFTQGTLQHTVEKWDTLTGRLTDTRTIRHILLKEKNEHKENDFFDVLMGLQT